MAIEQVTLRITGRLPLIMHNNRGVNPRDPLMQELKAVTAKRKKTDEDLDQISRLEWELGLYHDVKIGPYLRPDMVHACLREAAKRSKQGKTVIQAVMMGDPPLIPLEYEGPRDIDGLYAADGRFFDIRVARVQQARVLRARPIFHEWAATFTLLYDAEAINREDVLRIAEQAGAYIGLGDYRPIYGRFDVEEVRS